MKHKIPEFDETRNQKGNKKKATGIYSTIYSIVVAQDALQQSQKLGFLLLDDQH